jgi:DNA-binding CsgD family transcriptional regulator
MRSDQWKDALRAARQIAPESEWRRRLAVETRLAAECTFAAVMSCAPGFWMQHRFDSDPPQFNELMNEIGSQYFAKIENVGAGWQFTVPQYGAVFSPVQLDFASDFTDHFYRELLRPRGLNGYVVGFILSPKQVLLGAISLGSSIDSLRLLEQVRSPLQELVEAAAETVVRGLDFAQGFGAIVPDLAQTLASLTPRECQIAMLLREGMSDLNVSARLEISVETVATHVARIYEKLGVHRRSELVAVLNVCPLADPDALSALIREQRSRAGRRKAQLRPTREQLEAAFDEVDGHVESLAKRFRTRPNQIYVWLKALGIRTRGAQAKRPDAAPTKVGR